jgi:hypothetical protein
MMETTKEMLNPEIFSKTFQKDFPYPKNAYSDIFGEESNLLSNAEKMLEDTLETVLQYESEIFMLRYKEGMALQEIVECCGGVTEYIEYIGEDEDERWYIANDADDFQRIIARTLRKLRHPSRSKNLKSKLEF